MRKMYYLYAIISIVVVGLVVFRVHVIGNYEDKKIVSVKAQQEKTEIQNNIEKYRLQQIDYKITEQVTEMYNNKQTLYMTTELLVDLSIQNEEEIVKEFLNLYEEDIELAKQYFKNFKGFISYVIHLEEKAENGNPQATYVQINNYEEPIIITALENENHKIEIPRNEWHRNTYEYDVETLEIVNVNDIDVNLYYNHPHLLGELMSTATYPNHVPNKEVVIKVTFQLTPKYLPNHPDAQIELKELDLGTILRFSHR